MRYFIYLSYDGSNYHGWQIQPNGNSVQETLQHALSTLLRGDIPVVGAGRTDAGVNATEMVAHFDTNIPIDCIATVKRLNRFLPQDIGVENIVRVSDEAHARFSALARTYKYYVITGKSPMLRHFDRSMITSPRFQKYALDLARANGIPVQESVRSGGGTDGGMIHTEGVPCIVIGIPVRYIHSHHCWCTAQDYRAAVELAVKICETLDGSVLESF